LFEWHDLIGIPFKAGGRDFNGLDCYGLVKLLMQRQGIDLPEFAYADPHNYSMVDRLIRNQDVAQRLNRPEIGAIVVMSLIPPYEHHLGVVISRNEFIHIRQNTRVTISRLDSPLWRDRIRGFYRVRI